MAAPVRPSRSSQYIPTFFTSEPQVTIMVMMLTMMVMMLTMMVMMVMVVMMVMIVKMTEGRQHYM